VNSIYAGRVRYARENSRLEIVREGASILPDPSIARVKTSKSLMYPTSAEVAKQSKGHG